MADKPNINLSAEQLQELLAGILAKANQMNPLEAEQYQEQQEKKRRREVFKGMVRAEVEAQRARMAGCSHSRWPMSAGKLGGHAAPRGQGEWTTGGQVHNREFIGLVCIRCGTGWFFKGTPEELDYAENVGLLGFPPPAAERNLKSCAFCSEWIGETKIRAHEEKCPKRIALHPAAAEHAIA